MIRFFTVIALAMLLAACQQENTATETTQAAETTETVEVVVAENEKHSGILLDYMDTEVRPGDDFNMYVNGAWMETAEIPADRASDSVGLMVHEQSVENVKVIIEESADGDFAKGTDEQKVGDLYNSYMDMDTRNELGATPLQSEFAKIHALEDQQELAVYFAEANKFGVNVPFQLAQYADFKDPTTYMMYTWQAGLGLPDREYYFTEDERSENIRTEYVAHIEKMFDLAGLADGDKAAEMIMALETRMAAEHMLKEDTRDMVALYNKLPLAELPDLMPRFAWDDYLEAAVISDIDGLVVTQLDYMKALDGILQDTPMDDWKTYLTLEGAERHRRPPERRTGRAEF